MYSILDSHLRIRLIFSSSSRGTGAQFRRYNSCTHSISKKPTKNCRQVYAIQDAHKTEITSVMCLRNVLYCRFSYIDFACFLAHLREWPVPVFGFITLVQVLSQKAYKKLHVGTYNRAHT